MKRTVQILRHHHPKTRLILNLLDSQNDTDIAICVVLHPDDPESIARPLAQWQTLICASPDYLRGHHIAKPQDLLNANWLNHNSNVLLHAFKRIGLLETIRKPLAYFMQAAEEGDITGQYWLGHCYENGIGTAKDMTKAVHWYQESAKRGDHISQPAIDALNRLGIEKN
ncbi:TPA: SEL1-like repeat protein [Neisseria subflava]|jgi:transcriptional regulator, lysR family|uniref:SEL1-like repeat protein n=1 Tax=unclassified Neisseria TaxID=2623750 RepID=UPI0009F6421E|nr:MULTISPECIES: SEL1-like repeat protein [unclassified Neisseria]